MPSIFRLFSVIALAGLLVGCETQPSNSSKKLRKTVGETTQNVLKLDEALANGGQLAATSVQSNDYLTQQSEAYKTSVAKIAQMRVTHDIQIFEALNERKPENYDEFMSAIIKKGQADGIQLPMLPFYEEYAFDAKNCALVVVEFPAKKAEYEKERDKELGR
jgi:hypothetical protein